MASIISELEDLENFIRRVDRNYQSLKEFTERLALRVQELEDENVQLKLKNDKVKIKRPIPEPISKG